MYGFSSRDVLDEVRGKGEYFNVRCSRGTDTYVIHIRSSGLKLCEPWVWMRGLVPRELLVHPLWFVWTNGLGFQELMRPCQDVEADSARFWAVVKALVYRSKRWLQNVQFK